MLSDSLVLVLTYTHVLLFQKPNPRHIGQTGGSFNRVLSVTCSEKQKKGVHIKLELVVIQASKFFGKSVLPHKEQQLKSETP